jgi:hypothetical protein
LPRHSACTSKRRKERVIGKWISRHFRDNHNASVARTWWRRTGPSLYHNDIARRQSQVAAPQNPHSRIIPMAENKTKPTGASVNDYILERGNAQQRTDCRKLIAMLRRITGKPPRMWGPSIVGFGSYDYTGESGRAGTMPLAAFAIRGRDLVVYLWPDQKDQKSLRARLGPHKMGKSCLYFRELADIDSSVLEKLVVDSIDEVRRRYE